MADPAALNAFLFDLLLRRCAKSTGGLVFHLPCRHVAIEVANSLDDSLANSLPVLTWLPKTRLRWDLRRLKVDGRMDGDVQIVCAYLAWMEGGQVDHADLVVSGPAPNVYVLSQAECGEIVGRHFVEAGRGGGEGEGDGEEAMSFAVLQTFLRVLGHMLRILNGNYFFQAQALQVGDWGLGTGAGGWGLGTGNEITIQNVVSNNPTIRQ